MLSSQNMKCSTTKWPIRWGQYLFLKSENAKIKEYCRMWSDNKIAWTFRMRSFNKIYEIVREMNYLQEIQY